MGHSDLIRVLIVDDHPMVRDGLKMALTVNHDLACVGEASCGEDAVRICAELEPDVVLMDMVMPGLDGATATKIIRKQVPGTQVIALTSFQEKGLVQSALQAGAIGYLLKNISMERLVAAIQSAHRGEPSLAPEVTRTLMQTTASPQTTAELEAPDSELTNREMEVLVLMAKGLTNAAISQQLCISASTTRFHVSNILRKLSATNRTQAVRLAIEQNLLAEAYLDRWLGLEPGR